MGIDPRAKRILVIKSTNHFYAAFSKIASEIIYLLGGAALSECAEDDEICEGAAGYLADGREAVG